MKIFFPVLLMMASVHGAASTEPFVGPQAHPISRYETGWEKNPFTLKTAPVAIDKESFAKDLALAGWRQSGDDSIVILVNTKTRAYTRLKNQEPGSDGTKVKVAHLENRRSDTFVELERNNETAVVRYNESFMQQMASQGTAPKTHPQTAMQGQNKPGMNYTPATLAQPQIVSAPNITPPKNQGTRPVIAPAAPMLPTPPGAVPANNAPTIQRRRLNTLPQPPTR